MTNVDRRRRAKEKIQRKVTKEVARADGACKKVTNIEDVRRAKERQRFPKEVARADGACKEVTNIDRSEKSERGEDTKKSEDFQS